MKTYTATIEHLVGEEVRMLWIPKISANSFSMAMAIFEHHALGVPECGKILNIKVVQEFIKRD